MAKKMYIREEERVIYNMGVRDAMKELLKYDGVIKEDNEREYICNKILQEVSYAHPEPQPLKLK